MAESRQRNCVHEIYFCRELEELKGRTHKKMLFRRWFLQQGQTFLERKNREATPPFRKQGPIWAETINKMKQNDNSKEMGYRNSSQETTRK